MSRARVVMIFRPEGGLYFTSEAPGLQFESERARWTSQGYKVVNVEVDLEAGTARHIPEEGGDGNDPGAVN